MENTNPLKQYFRRPAVYLKLPSGGNYPVGVINIPENGELPVYPMTAIDEISTKTPDALFNGVVVTDLIKSCIPNIIDPWEINTIDLDSILIAIKSASGAGQIEVESKCTNPTCGESTMYDINLINALVQMKAGKYEEEFQIQDLSFKFRPLTYKEVNQASLAQFEVERIWNTFRTAETDKERAEISERALKEVTAITMKILASTIEYIKTPTTLVENKDFIHEFLQSCDKQVYHEIKNKTTELRSASEMKPLDVTCPKCNHQYKQSYTLNMSDFFG